VQRLKILMKTGKYYTYVLYSDKNKSLYIGSTNDLEKRFSQHNKGKVASTKPYRPYRLIYVEEFATKAEALEREKELKHSAGRRYLKQYI
jgi:putative endonuclease